MKILNPRNLPQAIVNAATPEEREIKLDRIGVTDLIGPAYLRKLKLQHWGELTEEVEKRFKLILGTALHFYLDSKAPEGSRTEEKLVVPFGDINVSGIPDIIYPSGKLDDYKYTSVWSFIFGKSEWEQQVNVYGYLARRCGIEITSLSILAFFYDWKELGMMKSPDYPRQPILDIDIPMWSEEEQAAFIESRLAAHREAAPCSPEERWRRESKWAVMKKGRKTALRLLNNEKEAWEWCEKNGCIGGSINDIDDKEHRILFLKDGVTLVERTGDDMRCLEWCPVRALCTESVYYGKELSNEDRED